MNGSSWARLGAVLERWLAGLICLDPNAFAYYLALVDSETDAEDHWHLIGTARRATEPTATILQLIDPRLAVRRLA